MKENKPEAKAMNLSGYLNVKIAHHKITLWIVAIVITVSSAVYQRLTGPTYPFRGSVSIADTTLSYRLLRSETVDQDVRIQLAVPDGAISGYVKYRRYRSHDDWSTINLQREAGSLVGFLPRQPAAGKLMYYVYLQRGEEQVSLTGEEPVVLRYKGAVPEAVLIPHVLFMFLAMLISNRAGLEALDRRGNAYKYMLWTMALFLAGGFIFGPLVQKHAFGEYWTGVPFGYDLTDNKTLIAMIGWLVAWAKNRKGRNGRGWIVAAAVLMMAVYLIPHSLLGSELDYTELPEQQ